MLILSIIFDKTSALINKFLKVNKFGKIDKSGLIYFLT